MINVRGRVARTVGALLGACALGAGVIGVGVASAHADPRQDDREAVMYAYDGRGVDVPSTVVSTVTGGEIVSTVPIESDAGDVVVTARTSLADFVAACEAGAVDGDVLAPASSSVTAVAVAEPDQPLESTVRARVYDWDGDFLADLNTFVTVERGYNDRFAAYVDTKLDDLGIEIGPGGNYDIDYDCGVVIFDCEAETAGTVTAASTPTATATPTPTATAPADPKPVSKFTADREGKDFATMVNRYLFHYKVEVGDDGKVTL